MTRVDSLRVAGQLASSCAATLLLAVPWVQSFSYGPSHVVVQSLIVWSFATLWWTISVAAAVPWCLRVQYIALGWALAAVSSAGIGLIQYFGAAGSFHSLIASADIGQAYGNLRQRNQLATLLNIGLAALIWVSVQKAEATKYNQVAVLLGTAILSIANAATSSRTGSAELVLLLVLGLKWRRGLQILLLSVVSYAVAVVLLPYMTGASIFTHGILGRVIENNPACTSRITLWSNVLHLITLKPWQGWGWGELSYAHFVTLYPGIRFCDILDNAHNLPLHIAVELGIPSAIFFCALCVWLVLRCRPWAERNAANQLAWSVLSLIGVHSLLEYPLWYAPFQLATVLSVWILWRNRTERLRYRATGGSATAVVVGQVAVATLCIFAAWDYWRVSQIYFPPQLRDVRYREDTLEKIRGSHLFQNHVKFAELSITPITRTNAEHIHTLALELQHFSPEPRVIEALIESSVMLGYDDEALNYLQRYEAAFPDKHREWSAKLKPQN